MAFTRRLADKFRSAPHDKCIYQRAKNVEPNIKFILYDNIVHEVSSKLSDKHFILSSIH